MSDMDEVKRETCDNNLAFISAGIALFKDDTVEAAAYIKLAIKQQPLTSERILAWAKKNNIHA